MNAERLQQQGEELKVIAEASWELANDLRYCAIEFERAPHVQFWRRASVFTLFASVELQTHFTKRALLFLSEAEFLEFSTAEVAILKEETYELKSNGKADIRAAKLRTADNLKFALSTLNRKIPSTEQLDVGGKGWEAFMNALSIRDRITHPKSQTDILVSETDMVCLSTASKFIASQMIAVATVLQEYGLRLQNKGS